MSVAAGGTIALAGVGVALVLWRTADIRSIPGFEQLVAQVFAFFG